MEPEVKKLEEFAKIFAHPTELAQRLEANMLRHYSELMDDVSDAIRKWDTKSYHDFGEDIGDAVLIALSPPQNHVVLSIKSTDVSDIVSGLVDGIIKKDDSKEIK